MEKAQKCNAPPHIALFISNLHQYFGTKFFRIQNIILFLENKFFGKEGANFTQSFFYPAPQIFTNILNLFGAI